MHTFWKKSCNVVAIQGDTENIKCVPKIALYLSIQYDIRKLPQCFVMYEHHSDQKPFGQIPEWTKRKKRKNKLDVELSYRKENFFWLSYVFLQTDQP